MLSRLVIAALALALCSCAHRLECTAHGGPEWNEVQTAHFSVQSDIPLEDAKAAANEFEKLRAAIRWYFKLPDEGEEVTNVLLVASSAEIREFKADWVEGFAFSDGVESTIVTTPPDNQSPAAQYSTMAHELSHRIAPLALLRLTTWLNEGLATYFESVRLLPGHQAKVGLVSNRIYAFYADQPLSLEDVQAWQAPANANPAQLKAGYASSWAWVHFLTNTQSARWQAFLNRLRRAEPPEYAFVAEFPRDSWPRLERDLRDYLEHARYGSSTLQLAKTSTVLRSRRMEPWEVHLLRRVLWQRNDAVEAVTRGIHAKLEADAARALASEPLPWPVARAMAPDQRDLIEAARKYPNDVDALLELARAESTCRAQLPILRQAQQLSPRQPQVLGDLASCLAGQDEVEAQAVFERARAQVPWHPKIELTRARLASHEGRCDEIDPAVNQAVALLSESTDTTVRTQVEQARSQYQAECRTTPPLTCAEALRNAAKAKTAEGLGRAANGCAPLFEQTACADAWRAAASMAPAERVEKLNQACAAAYCPAWKEPKPAACSEKNLSRDDRIGFFLRILFAERLRAPTIAAVFGALENLEQSGQPLAFGPGDGTPMLWQLDRGLPPNAVRRALEAADSKPPQCAAVQDFLLARLNIGGDGHVVSAKVTARSRRDDAYESCLLAKWREVVFPAPVDRAPLSVNVSFTSD